MPEIDYKDRFVVKHKPKQIVAGIVASVCIMVIFAALSFLVDRETWMLYLIFIILGAAILLFSVEALTYRCVVTEETLSTRMFFVFRKTVRWDNVICVRKCETTDEETVTIALYDTKRKCVLDVFSSMQNAWYILKMAERKQIEIREEKDLSLKQLRKL